MCKSKRGIDREVVCEREIVCVCATESELCHCVCVCHVNDVSIFIDESFRIIPSLKKKIHLCNCVGDVVVIVLDVIVVKNYT